MKRHLFFSATLLLAATLAFSGCDLLSLFFEQEKGERFDADGLEQVFEAMEKRNYTAEAEDGSINYIMENAIVEAYDPTVPGWYSHYAYYDTTPFFIASDGSVSIMTKKLNHYGDSNSPYDFHYEEDIYHADSIQDLYRSFGLGNITTYDWEYDEKEKLYRADDGFYGITLKIEGRHVSLTFEYTHADGETESTSVVLKNFGVTEYDLSVFSKKS